MASHRMKRSGHRNRSRRLPSSVQRGQEPPGGFAGPHLSARAFSAPGSDQRCTAFRYHCSRRRGHRQPGLFSELQETRLVRARSVMRRPRKERLERSAFLSRGTSETERRDYRALAGHFAGEILGNGNIERSRIPGEQGASDIFVDDPYDLAGAIVKRSQNMRDVDDVSGFVDELTAKRRIWSGIDPLV